MNRYMSLVIFIIAVSVFLSGCADREKRDGSVLIITRALDSDSESEITSESVKTAEVVAPAADKQDTTQAVTDTETEREVEEVKNSEFIKVIVNKSTKTFHANLNCRHVKSMNDGNKAEMTATVDEIRSKGYKPCGTCSKAYK